MEAVPGMTCFWNQSKCRASLLDDDCKTEDRKYLQAFQIDIYRAA